MADRKLVLGILAHVDAGKTTLAENILYLGGVVRSPGRVDHRDTFLDTDRQERERGITIFSKQARFVRGGVEVILLDTPGHVDFSAETERTLQVLDCAVLVISGADGVQGHVPTLWRLLERYRVPVFLFINKMDQPGTDAAALMAELKRRLNNNCVYFGGLPESLYGSDREFYEELAVSDEALLERYLDTGGPIGGDVVTELVAARKVFPCYFGSALKGDGVEALLDGLLRYTAAPRYPDAFGARVYKIARDEQGNRLSYIKITGGTLKVKQTVLTGRGAHGAADGDGPDAGKRGGEAASSADSAFAEKIDQIRLYSGSRYTTAQEVSAGDVCALVGPCHTFCGEGLGVETGNIIPLTESVMTYRVMLPEGCDVHKTYQMLCQLEEEEPLLHVVWRERQEEIQIRLMGEIQTEVLRKMIAERYGLEVDFDRGSIAYRETIASAAEGVGHYEPLRHYAEVHLLLEPGEPGSGLVFGTACSEDVLDRNWQRLVLTHLEEKEHLGILTGSPVTDMRITLVSGRAHPKHTEGGDFRQAVYRAVRQGLCRAGCVLLEPVCSFRLELPAGLVGRAMSDLQGRSARFSQPETDGETAVLSGTVPASEAAAYRTEVLAYSGGRGTLDTTFAGYEPCHNAEEVIAAIGYDAQRDTENPCGSVFCAHGAGFVVEWDRVEEYMHLESAVREAKPQQAAVRRSASVTDAIGQDEIDEIMNRTYGVRERKKQGWARTIRPVGTDSAAQHTGTDSAARHTGTNSAAQQGEADTAARPAVSQADRKAAQRENREEYLLVDGYNIIFAWDSLKKLAADSLDAARSRLTDILCNYQASRGMRLILVFDAYKVKGNPGSTTRCHNIDVVYTAEAETADQYIEKVTHRLSRDCQVRVATSDGLEQMIILGAGAVRMSARELEEDVALCEKRLREEYTEKTVIEPGGRNYLLPDIPGELRNGAERTAPGESDEQP